MDSIRVLIPYLLLLVVLLTPIVDSQNSQEGYEYPTPAIPLTLPPKTTTTTTTKKPEGYEYPTPKVKLTLPPKTTTTTQSTTTTTQEGYEYPEPSNPLNLPRRGRRRPLESHKITPGKIYKTCFEMAKDNQILPRPGVNCLHVPDSHSSEASLSPRPSNKSSETLPLLRNIPEDILHILQDESTNQNS